VPASDDLTPDEVGDIGTGAPVLAESVVDRDLACMSNRRSGAQGRSSI